MKNISVNHATPSALGAREAVIQTVLPAAVQTLQLTPHQNVFQCVQLVTTMKVVPVNLAMSTVLNALDHLQETALFVLIMK